MQKALPLEDMKSGIYTDKYFTRSRQILEKEGINPIVRYQVFARKDGTVKGVDEAVSFVKDMVGDKATIYALNDGDDYTKGEALMKIEGHVQDLVELETVYLSIISDALTEKTIDMNKIRKNAREVVQAAEGKPVFYFGARHFHWSLDEEISGICEEEGFAGCSTDVGAKAWNAEGIGTIPHALILSYAAYMHENGIKGNPTVEAVKGFDKYIDSEVPRIDLIDTFNREIDDSIASAEAIDDLAGVRIDTAGENYSQGSEDITLPDLDVDEKYIRGTGVTIAGVWALRRALDESGHENIYITVSSGFNSEKTKAFVAADKVYKEMYGKSLFDAVGTGSLLPGITMATSDIVAYFNTTEQKWIEHAKTGRGEKPSDWLTMK